jgi:hypothetical protein
MKKIHTNQEVKKPRTPSSQREQRLSAQQDMAQEDLVRETVAFCNKVAENPEIYQEEEDHISSAQRDMYPAQADRSNILKKKLGGRLKKTKVPKPNVIREVAGSFENLLIEESERIGENLFFSIYDSCPAAGERNTERYTIRPKSNLLGCSCSCKCGKRDRLCKHKLFIYVQMKFDVDEKTGEVDLITLQNHLTEYEFEELTARFIRMKKEGFSKEMKITHKKDLRFCLSVNEKSVKRCANTNCQKEINRDDWTVFTDALKVDAANMIGREKRIYFCLDSYCVNGQTDNNIINNDFLDEIHFLRNLQKKKDQLTSKTIKIIDKMKKKGVKFID